MLNLGLSGSILLRFYGYVDIVVNVMIVEYTSRILSEKKTLVKRCLRKNNHHTFKKETLNESNHHTLRKKNLDETLFFSLKLEKSIEIMHCNIFC